jgi:hypothetical protein
VEWVSRVHKERLSLDAENDGEDKSDEDAALTGLMTSLMFMDPEVEAAVADESEELVNRSSDHESGRL